MAKKGTPEYEIWLKHYREKRQKAAHGNSSNSALKRLKKTNSSIHSIILSIEIKEKKSEDTTDLIDNLSLNFTKDEIRKANLKLSNFKRVLKNPEGFPLNIQSKYNEKEFKKVYTVNYNLISNILNS